MAQYIAILRGINVGGKRKILMADLKGILGKLGFNDVVTYIQSGNVIFNLKEEVENKVIENKISDAIKGNYSFDVPVIVRSKQEWAEVIRCNPFTKNTAIEHLHLTFLGEIPPEEQVEQLKAKYIGSDLFEIIDNNAFISIKGGYHETKLTNAFFENKLKIKATTRNWKTVIKLSELLK